MATEYNIEGHFMAQISVLIQNVVPTDDFCTGNESKNIKKKRKMMIGKKYRYGDKWPKNGLNFIIFGFVAIIWP